MDHQPCMRMSDGASDLQNQLEYLLDHWRMLGAITIDGHAFHIFHCHERAAQIIDAGVVQSRDVGMLERRENVLLARHAFGESADPGDVRQLECDASFEGAVVAFGEPHTAHAAAAQFAHETIGSDGIAGRWRAERRGVVRRSGW